MSKGIPAPGAEIGVVGSKGTALIDEVDAAEVVEAAAETGTGYYGDLVANLLRWPVENDLNYRKT